MILNPLDVFKESEIETENLELNEKDIIDYVYKEILADNSIFLDNKNQERLLVKAKIKKILYEKYELSKLRIEEIIKNTIYKIYGYGILEEYINQDNITDIRIVNYDLIYIKRNGIWIEASAKFNDKQELTEFIKSCAIKNGAVLNYENPLAIFSDRQRNLRIEAGIEPVNIDSPSLVIRIHKKNRDYTLGYLKDKYKLLSDKDINIIKDSIKKEETIIICGKGGSGKTTLLKAIINELPSNISITSTEETAELFLHKKNAIQRECILTRAGDLKINLDKLTRHSMVMSTDVIVVGEIKSKEASAFLDAISTGHIGYASIHANNSINAIDRIITLIKKDPNYSYYKEEFLNKILKASINKIIFMKNFKIKEIFDVKET